MLVIALICIFHNHQVSQLVISELPSASIKCTMLSSAETQADDRALVLLHKLRGPLVALQVASRLKTAFGASLL